MTVRPGTDDVEVRLVGHGLPQVTVPTARPGPDGASTAGVTTAAATAGSGTRWSAEVQALRAVAVLLVVAFHLWPDGVPGGYVGVDVFFVVSGFLISGNIVRDLEAGRFSLRGFYVRRARRLLPAALLVLLVVGVATPLLTSRLVWAGTAQQVLASAAYVQNWVLARQRVDYFTPELWTTPVQHFWSLSVEEQFYLGWPLLLLGTVLAVRRWRRRSGRSVRSGGRAGGPPRGALAAVMAAVAALSFGYGVVLTSHDAGRAYFSSLTRAWEFAAGALLALLLRPSPARPVLRGLMTWAGLGVVVASAFALSSRTPFPGWAALLPVAGTVLFLASGRCDARFSPGLLVRSRPARFFGDTSYSLYLWHWPVLSLAPAVIGVERLGGAHKVLVLQAAVLLAWLSTTHVENRFREHRPGAADVARPEGAGGARAGAARRPRLRGLGVVLVLAVAVGAVSGGTWLRVERRVAERQRLADAALAGHLPCFGSAGLEPGCSPPLGDVVVPDPAFFTSHVRDNPYSPRCLTSLVSSEVKTCTFGAPDARQHVVLFGDSHAMQWLPALLPTLAPRDRRLTVVTRASCTPNLAMMIRPTRAEREACQRWVTAAAQRIASDPTVDVVLTSSLDNKEWESADGDPYRAGTEGFRRTWRRFTDAGASVVVLRDTPRPLPGERRVQECVLRHGDAERCGRGREPALRGRYGASGRRSPAVEAALTAGPRVHLADLSDAICGPTRCPAVVGNVLVYSDDSHLTWVFTRTLADRLDAALAEAVAGPPV